MKLFQINSIEDLICRGYKRQEILDLTNVDTGYNNNKFNKHLKGVDRIVYKYEHVKQRFNDQQINDVLHHYASGSTKKDILHELGIHDYEKCNLKRCFEYLGYASEFEIANNKNRDVYLTNGMIEKYGIDNPFNMVEFQEKALQTRVERYDITRRDNIDTYKKSDEYLSLSKPERMQYTSMLRYGVPYPSQSDTIRRKVIKTNMERYGTPTNLQHEDTIAKIKQTNLEKYGFEHPASSPEVKTKRHQTNLERYDHVNPLMNEAIDKKARSTMQKRYGVDYAMQSEINKDKAKRTSLKKFGYEFAVQNPTIKQKAIQSNMNRYGVAHASQLPERRLRQSNYMRENQDRINHAKKKNRTFNTSSQESTVLTILKELFPDVISQYRSKEYPHNCDFYIPSRNLYIELNISWTHDTHWFDENSPADVEKATMWSTSTKYHQNAHKAWTYYDVQKRADAKKSNLNYVVFWQRDLSDFNLWIQMGCPDAHDWEREYSWLEITTIPQNCTVEKITPLTNGSKTVIKIARQFMYPVIYEREINMWNNNVMTNKGSVQPHLFANRLKYLNKLPHELSNLDIIRGLNISGQIKAYTAFDNTLMKQVIEKYQPKSIFDPCAGWGERLLTAASYDVPYKGQDINKQLKAPYSEMIAAYDLTDQQITIVDSSATYNEADMLFTCPPYGNIEIYTNIGAENLSEDDFLNWWDRVTQNVNVNIIAFQINQKWKDRLSEIVQKNGYTFLEELQLTTKANHFNKKKKEYESVMVFKKPPRHTIQNMIY